MQVPIISGIYASGLSPDFRTAYPRNLVPVPKQQGISNGYLRPADGIVQNGTGQGVDRGGINWNGVLYRVSGTSLIRVDSAGAVTVLGNVGGTRPVTMDYSFDRLAIASGGKLYYWNGGTLSQVTDADLGTVVDMRWIAGYFITTDGTSLVQTDLADPASINPLHYGSSESDPDPIMAVDEMRNELYALNRYTIEVYENIGGTGFVFQRLNGAQVIKGVVGTHAYTSLGDTFMFVGSGRNETLGVYQMVPGNVSKISTREVDEVLANLTDAQAAAIVVDSRVEKAQQLVQIHLPDQCLVYDTMGSQAAQQPLWHILTTSVVGAGQYRARAPVWCYGRWNVGDPASSALGYLEDSLATHWGQVNGWDFSTQMLYADGNSGIIHELELVALSGRAVLGADPVIWTQYSNDGVTWSREFSVKAGKLGQTMKRIAWRTQGMIRHWRIQKFRGTSDAYLSIVKLEAQVEPLFTKAASYG